MSGAAIAALRAETHESISFRPSTRAFLFKSGAGWLLIAAVVVTMGMGALVVIPLLGLKYLNNVTTRFALEGDRLLMRRGVFFRSEEEIELYRIKDIKATFSLIQQIFGNGDIAIISSDQTGKGIGRLKPFAITNVENAREIREELRARVEASRRRVGVREYDFA